MYILKISKRLYASAVRLRGFNGTVFAYGWGLSFFIGRPVFFLIRNMFEAKPLLGRHTPWRSGFVKDCFDRLTWQPHLDLSGP